MAIDDVDDDLPFPVVNSYIAKAHYGMAFKEEWDELRHSDADRKEYDEVEKMYIAWDQMSWYISKVSRRNFGHGV